TLSQPYPEKAQAGGQPAGHSAENWPWGCECDAIACAGYANGAGVSLRRMRGKEGYAGRGGCSPCATRSHIVSRSASSFLISSYSHSATITVRALAYISARFAERAWIILSA